MTRTFVHLYSGGGMDPCSMPPDRYTLAVDTWLCRGCVTPKPDVGSVDLHIQERRPTDSPMTFVSGTGVILAHSALIERLDPNSVEHDLMLGRVFNEANRELTDWVTVRGRERALVRGSAHVSHRVCDVCGRHVYFGMGERYLFPAPSSSRALIETQFFGLLMPRAPDLSGLSKKLTCELLQVVESPADGLGELK